jgi:hypothetical protein
MSLKGRLERLGIQSDELAAVGGLTATATELNRIADVSSGLMSASTVMAALIEAYNVQTVRSGNIIKTTMYLDITGAKSTTTDLDIIGNTGACHIGQVTTAVNGLLFKAQMSCAETPATGADDINLATLTVATGAYDADASGLTGYVLNLDSSGAWVKGLSKLVTTAPAANSYLYLINGEAGVVGTYTAGKFLIEMWGLVV